MGLLGGDWIMGGLIHLWIHNLMGLGGGTLSLKKLSFLLFPGYQEASLCFPTTHFAMTCYLTTGLKANKPSDYGLKL
jgi:hypothetical protein